MKKIKIVGLAVLLALGSFGLKVEALEEDHQAYIDGYRDGTIKPKNNIKREEAAKVLAKALKLEKKDDRELDFKDMKAGEWSYDSVKKAYDNGLIEGDEKGNFNPRGDLERREAIAMIVRYQNPDIDNIVVSNPEYKDDWASQEIQYALDKGILTGYTDGTVRPKGNINRAEFITIINSILERECKLRDINIVNDFKDINEGDWFYRDIIEAANSHSSLNYNDKLDIGKKHYEVASLKPWIEENQEYLEWEGVPVNVRKSFRNYYNYQVDVRIIDGKMSEDKSPNAFHFVIGNKIGGSLNMSVNSKDGHDEKGITISSYVNNGPDWNLDNKPRVQKIEKGDYYAKRNIYELYYDSILENGLSYHMNPGDVIDVDVRIDYNDGDFIEYNIKQDVSNKYFNSSYYNQIRQWDHKTKPIKKETS